MSKRTRRRVVAALLLVVLTAAGGALIGSPADEVTLTYTGSALWSGMTDLALDNDYVYCGMTFGLQIIDVSDKQAPILEGQVYLNQAYRYDVSTEGNYAYVCDSRGLSIINASDAHAPFLVGGYETTGRAYGARASDTLVIVAEEIGGLLILNAADAQSPVLIASFDTPGTCRGLDIRDTLVYVADWTAGVQIVNIADPQNPALLGGCSTIGYPRDLVVCDSLAYVAAGSGGLQIVSVVNPLAPTVLGGLDNADDAHHVVVDDTLAYLRSEGSPDRDSTLRIVSVADPANPYVISAYGTSSSTGAVAVDDTVVLVTDLEDGMHLVNVSAPEAPTLISMYETPPRLSDLACAGDYAYVSTLGYEPGNVSLYVVDIADPTNPSIVGCCDTLACGYRMALTDTAVILVRPYPYYYLEVVSVANPQHPYVVARLDIPGYGSDITTDGDYAYVAGDDGMLILDVSDPGTPVPVDSFVIEGFDYGVAVAVRGDYAYLTGGGLRIINIADPHDLYLEGTLPLSNQQTDIVVFGRYAYMTRYILEIWQGYLDVIDVDSVQAPTWLGQYEVLDDPLGVELGGNHAYVSTYSGLIVINIADPDSMYLAGEYLCGSSETELRGGYVYVADYSGLLILEGEEVDDCGDADGSGVVNISDVTYLIAYIFGGGPPPDPLHTGDVDCNELVNISDAVYLITYIFGGGAEPCAACP